MFAMTRRPFGRGWKLMQEFQAAMRTANGGRGFEAGQKGQCMKLLHRELQEAGEGPTRSRRLAASRLQGVSVSWALFVAEE